MDFKLFSLKDKKINLFGISKGSIIVAVIVSLILAVALFLKIDQEHIWKLLIDFQKETKINLGEDLNKKIISDPKLLDYKVKRDVDQAITDYQRLIGDDGVARVSPPRYSERPVDTSVCYTDECKSLGGEMRLCASWVPDCPPENVK